MGSSKIVLLLIVIEIALAVVVTAVVATTLVVMVSADLIPARQLPRPSKLKFASLASGHPDVADFGPRQLCAVYSAAPQK